MVIVDDPDFAQLLRFPAESVDLLQVVGDEAHFEQLVIRAVLLGADEGNVQAVFFDPLQQGGDAAGDVPEPELHQDHAFFAAGVLEIADLLQPFPGLLQLRFRTLRVDKQAVGVHRLVVADPGQIHAQVRKDPAGLEKCPDMVGHHRYKGSFHGDSSRFHGFWQFLSDTIPHPKRKRNCLF